MYRVNIRGGNTEEKMTEFEKVQLVQYLPNGRGLVSLVGSRSSRGLVRLVGWGGERNLPNTQNLPKKNLTSNK